ncbi:hypothetical protein ACSQ67_016335 [Phaseolus vulgaris]
MLVSQPSLVIVYFGGNDSIDPHSSGLGPHVPLEEYVENMRKIANHLKLCEEMNLKAINLRSAIRTGEDWLDVSFTDGVHPSAEGSKVVVKEILRVPREADWKTSLHWMSMPTEYAEDSPYYPPTLDGTKTINVSHIFSEGVCSGIEGLAK